MNIDLRIELVRLGFVDELGNDNWCNGENRVYRSTNIEGAWNIHYIRGKNKGTFIFGIKEENLIGELKKLINEG